MALPVKMLPIHLSTKSATLRENTGPLFQLKFFVYLDRKVVGDDNIEWRVDHLLQHKGGVVAQVIQNKII